MKFADCGTCWKTARNHGADRIKKSAKPAINPASKIFPFAIFLRRKISNAKNETAGIANAIGPLIKNPKTIATHPAKCHLKNSGFRIPNSEFNSRQLRQKK